MNKHDIIYKHTASNTWLATTQIAALDAVVAEHGKTWRKLVETRWYNGSNRDIGVEVYCIRNNPGQCYKALDLYTEIKAGKATVVRSIRVSPTKVIEEPSIIQATGVPRYSAVMYDSDHKPLVSVDLTTLEKIANWHEVIMKESEEVSRTHELEYAYLCDGVTGEVVESYDPVSKTAVS